MSHCRRRGAQLLLGKTSHIHVFEHGGVAQVSGTGGSASRLLYSIVSFLSGGLVATSEDCT